MGGKKDKDPTGRKSVANKYHDESGRKSKIPAAYPSTMMVDLQVYVVPREKWVLSRRLYRHNIVEEGISLGFVRVLPQLSIHNLRREMQLQLGADLIPRDFTFVRSVGNIFIQLKPKQEIELKVKNFIPPFSTEPEIYILEVLPHDDSRMMSMSPLPMLLREDTPPHICHDLCHHSRARKSITKVLQMSTMNITIIIPALQLPSSKQSTDSPQPTTPFPPINISPSPTPTPSLSTKSSYTPASMLMANSIDFSAPDNNLNNNNNNSHASTSHIYQQQQHSYSAAESHFDNSPEPDNDEEDDYEDYEDYDDDPFLPLSETPISSEIQVPESESLPPPPSSDTPVIEGENDQLEEEQEEEDDDDESWKEHDDETPGGVDVEEEELQRNQNYSALSFENSDTVSVDTGKTESVSSSDTVIHVLQSTEIESESANFENEEERPISKASCSSQTNFDDHDLPESADTEAKQENDEEEEEEQEKEGKEEKVTAESESPVQKADTVTSTVEAEDKAESESSSSHPARPALLRQSSIVVADETNSTINDEEVKEEEVKIEEGDELLQQQKTSTPVAESIMEDQKELIESLASSVDTLTLHAPLSTTPPTIITTPASAQGERTEHENLDNKESHLEEAISPKNDHDNVAADSKQDNNHKKAEIQTKSLEQPVTTTSTKPKKRLKSVRKVKSRAYPNPRKPSNYPQRTNKVTLARQALAREKRRVYVEERIQSYIKNAQANYIAPLPSSSSTHHHQHHPQQHTTNYHHSNNNNSFLESSSMMTRSHHHDQQNSTTNNMKHNNNADHPLPPSHTTNHSHTNDNSNNLDAQFMSMSASSLANSTFGAIDTPKLNELQSHIQKQKKQRHHHHNQQQQQRQNHHGSSHTPQSQSLPHIVDSKNYYLNNPLTLPTPPLKNLSAITPGGVARVHSHNRRAPFKSTQVSSYHQSSSMTLPLMGTDPTSSVPQISSFHSGSETVKHSIYAVPSTTPNDSESQSPEKSWKGVEHHGYFYSFRVRQSGPVQMMDKSVQTGTTVSPEPQAHSYTLSFLETHSTSDSYIICTNTTTTTTTTSDKTSPPEKNNHSDSLNENSVANNLNHNDQPPDDSNLNQGDKILREIAETVQLRHDAELRRADLVQRANDLQTRVKEKRDKINRRHEFWHKKYIEESSLTRPLEASCSSLRAELNTVHRRLLAHLEGRDLPLRLRDGPSKKANYKIMAARLQHEIKELQQKVKSAKLKLESEVKLKEQADREVREIRNDLSHKKVVMSLARSQVSTLPAVHARSYDSLVY